MTDKVIVFGSEGFIGSHLVEQLVKKNYKVKAFILYNFTNSKGWISNIDKNILKQVEIVFGDIRDYQSVNSAIKNCDYIINLAALIGIPYSYRASESYLDTNVKGTLNILNSSMSKSIRKIIIASTSEVYGSGQYFPIDENHPLNAQSPYAASKIAADQLALSFYKSFQLPVSIVRPFNTYGPRQSNRAVIPTIISQHISSSKILNIGSLDTIRDFTYVTDTAEGFICAIKSKKSIGEVVNLGTGYALSIRDIIKIVSEATEKKLIVKVDKNRKRPAKSEVNKLLSSNKKAEKILKWKPKFNNKNGFVKGINYTIKWFSNKENQKLYDSKKYTV